MLFNSAGHAIRSRGGECRGGAGVGGETRDGSSQLLISRAPCACSRLPSRACMVESEVSAGICARVGPDAGCKAQPDMDLSSELAESSTTVPLSWLAAQILRLIVV